MKFFLTLTTASLLTQSILGDLDYEEPVTFGDLDTASYDFSSYHSDNCNAASASSSADSTDASTSTGDDGTDGQKYENKYAHDYSKYYNGDNGDSGYDHGNDNGSGKQQQVMCDCTKKAKKDAKDDKSSFDNDVFSKCVNNEFGNNAWTWDHKYLKKYTKDSILDGGDTPSTTGITSTAVGVGGDDGTGGEKSGLMSGNANLLENSDSDAAGAGAGDVDSHSITHSDYMSYLAIFLMFVGAVLLVTLGLNCFKYTWKAYRLRNYEAIGATSKQTKEKQQQQKNHRIRLPRKHDTIRNDNEIYTIGNV